jgi:putative membrane protein
MRLRREHLTTGLAVGAAVIVTALATGLWSFGDRPEERAVAPNPPTTTDNPQGSEQAHGKAEALDPSSTATGSGIGGGLTGTSQASADAQQQGTLGSSGTSTPPASTLGLADQNFVTSAAAAGLYEVTIARTALQKVTDVQVRAFADMLVQHHTAANEQLKVLAAKKGLALPTEVPAGKKPMLERLNTAQAPQFDRQFVETVGIADHKDDISMFERAAREARDPEIKAFAERTLPTLKAHLAAAQRLPVSATQAAGPASR